MGIDKKLKSLTTLSPPSLNCMEEQPDLDKQKKRHLEKNTNKHMNKHMNKHTRRHMQKG